MTNQRFALPRCRSRGDSNRWSSLLSVCSGKIVTRETSTRSIQKTAQRSSLQRDSSAQPRRKLVDFGRSPKSKRPKRGRPNPLRPTNEALRTVACLVIRHQRPQTVMSIDPCHHSANE